MSGVFMNYMNEIISGKKLRKHILWHSAAAFFLSIRHGFHWPDCDQIPLLAIKIQMRGLDIHRSYSSDFKSRLHSVINVNVRLWKILMKPQKNVRKSLRPQFTAKSKRQTFPLTCLLVPLHCREGRALHGWFLHHSGTHTQKNWSVELVWTVS